MTRSVLPVLGVASITIATVMGSAPDPVRGREIFLANCAACHGSYADGAGAAAAALGINAPDLTEIATRRDGKFPYDEIRGIIEGRRDVAEHGPRIMPVWGEEFAVAAGGGMRGENVAWDKVEALVAYLETVQTDYEPP